MTWLGPTEALAVSISPPPVDPTRHRLCTRIIDLDKLYHVETTSSQLAPQRVFRVMPRQVWVRWPVRQLLQCLCCPRSSHTATQMKEGACWRLTLAPNCSTQWPPASTQPSSTACHMGNVTGKRLGHGAQVRCGKGTGRLSRQKSLKKLLGRQSPV